MRDPDVVEAMLEAQYMRFIAEAIAAVHGAYKFQFYKPSAVEEAFLGFDQGWVHNEKVGAKQLFAEIKDAIAGRLSIPTWFWAFFLQFKCVEKIGRRSSSMPTGFVPPYYRSEISLKPNRTTRMSQHETLLRLTNIPKAEVYYACPMMFSRDDVYRNVDPESLRLIDVSTAPAGYLANQRHYIAFRSPKDVTPAWCSEPVATASFTAQTWIEQKSFADRFDGAVDGIISATQREKNIIDVAADEAIPSFVDIILRNGNGKDNGDDDDGDYWSPSGVPMSLLLVRARRSEP